MVLSEAEIGEQFKVRRVRLEREVGRRLADMGFVEGAEGRVVRREFFGGPIEVNIFGSQILLRRAEAHGIEIDGGARGPHGGPHHCHGVPHDGHGGPHDGHHKGGGFPFWRGPHEKDR
jgi:ferrous iron transport protein A